jgi:predicted PurR-regulated permease PerM
MSAATTAAAPPAAVPVPVVIDPAAARLAKIRLASQVLVGIGLLALLPLGLLPALLAGLVVYAVVDAATPLLSRRIPAGGARVLVVTVLAAIVVALLVASTLGVVSFARVGLGDSDKFWVEQVMPVVDKARQQLPQQWIARLPDSVDELRDWTLNTVRTHAAFAAQESARLLVHILIGLVLGAILSLSRVRPRHEQKPLAAALSQRSARLAASFHQVVFAQVRISLVYTFLTALFLLGVLPLFGVWLPFAKTLVVITFLAGLLPVIGNLISNTIITVVALSVSFGTGVAALAFLVVIHKLEYFLNARIIGTRIRANAWEVLVAMLVMEAAFGISGVIAAPIYYAYLKSELEASGLV